MSWMVAAPRRWLGLAALVLTSASAFSLRVGQTVKGSRVGLIVAFAEHHSVTWKATDEGKDEEKWIEFSEQHYYSMLADERRTDLFMAALEERLALYPRGTATVLDLGTGPYALFAKAAVAFGAKKVYAIEAVSASAARARSEVAMMEQREEIEPGVIEIVEGFSTDVGLPEQVDILISEIAGSVASEEGVYATIRDAQRRFMKRPNDPSSYIPFAYQTMGAPATDLCHHSGGADPDAGCLRIQSHDETLLMLADPLLVEDICFSEDLPGSGTVETSHVWQVDPSRVASNERHFFQVLNRDKEAVESNGLEVGPLAREVSRSFSGIAMWPRIVFDAAGSMVYDARGPRGESQESHWPTVLAPLTTQPLVLDDATVVKAKFIVDLRDGKVDSPLQYSIICDLTNGDTNPWTAYEDETTGQTYYHNIDTQQTQWEKP